MDPLHNSIPRNKYSNYGFPQNKNINVYHAYTEKKSCVPTVKINNKTYYVHVDCKDICPRINRVVVDNLEGAANGTYTYLLYKEDGVIHIAYALVQSAMEYGSLHKSLFYEVAPNEIIIAGECKKEDDTIFYNFMSGTYALKIFEKHGYNAPAQEAYAHDTITPLLQSQYPMLTFTYTTRPASFIPSSLKVTVEEIQQLEAKGFEVKLFEDKNMCSQCSGNYDGYRAAIAQYEEAIQREQIGMKKNPKLYVGSSIPYWTNEIERLNAIIAQCSGPQLHLRDVLPAGGKRRTKTHRKKITKHRRKTQHRRR